MGSYSHSGSGSRAVYYTGVSLRATFIGGVFVATQLLALAALIIAGHILAGHPVPHLRSGLILTIFNGAWTMFPFFPIVVFTPGSLIGHRPTVTLLFLLNTIFWVA
ncbi:hypothetical protein C8F01DRAFT_1098909, partial [Mycena amicta]